MALSLSPPDRNDQHHLSFLPHALPHHAWRTPPGAYAALPDLPHYARSNSGHSGSGSSSGSGSRSNPPSPKISKSAPASPSGRMGFYVSPMSTITPISLSGSQSPGVSTRDIGTRGELGRSTIPQLTPQQLAQLQAAQAIAIGHSYYPSGSALHTRPGDAPVQDQNNPQQIHSSAGPSRIRSQPVGVTAANYNSSNQLSPTSSPIAIPSPATRQSKSRSRSRHLRAESGSDTERGFDSDVTVMDRRRPGKASYSQTDLPALRSRLEGWRSGVSAPGGEAVADVGNTSRDSLGLLQIRNTDTITLPKPPGRRTPPATPSHRPVQLSNNPAPLPPPLAKQHSVPSGTFSSPRSRSSTSLASLRRSPNSSPRTIHAHLAPLTPVTPSLTFPPNVSPRIRTTDDGATSGDADEENDSQTDSQPDSELSFRTKSSGLRRRTGADVRSTALELSLGGTSSGGDKSDTTTTRTVGDIAPKPHAIERLYHASSLLSLRILAIVPSMWGTLVLSQALVSGGLWYDVWPWGADFSSEALYRLSQGGGDYEGDWRKVVRGDILLAVGWAILTGHFCFRFTTGLTYRWRSYYDLFAVLIRLLSLQALCWPATYLPLWYLGPSQPLFAWAVIGVSTGITYAVIMWLASNVVPTTDGDSIENARSQSKYQEHKVRAGSFSVGSGNETPTKHSQAGTKRCTPGKRRRAFPNWGDAPLQAPPEPPESLSWWEKLNYRRRWDWDLVAMEVGWKVGGLLLLSAAWVFWQVHIGWLVRPEGWDLEKGSGVEV